MLYLDFRNRAGSPNEQFEMYAWQIYGLSICCEYQRNTGNSYYTYESYYCTRYGYGDSQNLFNNLCLVLLFHCRNISNVDAIFRLLCDYHFTWEVINMNETQNVLLSSKICLRKS